VFGLAAAVLALAPNGSPLTTRRLWIASAALGLAGAARPQVAPAVAVLAVSMLVRAPRPATWIALGPLAAAAAFTVSINTLWFGSPLGAVPRLEALHPVVHRVEGTFSATPWRGAAGLLFSPSRGLLIFSPIVAVAIAGLGATRREGWRGDLRWCWTAAAAQFLLYASYTVWWGGHTYGPRYCLDLLPMLLPPAAAGMTLVAGSYAAARAASIALAWSVLLAGTGAYCYPNDEWNTDPVSADTHHERFWQWSDPQFVRCWQRGPSPQNFNLLSRASVRAS
jgi:hypothetical protein